jgi:transcriptional regulator with XRE-family HTH domain
MNTKSKKIAAMAASLAGNPEVEQRVLDAISANSMVSCLLAMRVKKCLTQEQVAQRMKCNPSKVSRMESGSDLQLKWADVVCYASAINMNMCVLFEDPSLPAAERIKQCVFSISEDLDKLTDLAKQVGGNDEIAKKIHQFSGEVLLNFLLRFKDHSEKLQSVVKLAPHQPHQAITLACASEQLLEKQSEEEPVSP